MEQIVLFSSILLWIMVLFNLLLTLALVRWVKMGVDPSESPLVKSMIGQKAPDFTAETLLGENVTFDLYRGRKVVFVFISTSCPPCIESLPYYKGVESKAVSAGFDLILVSISSGVETRTFVEQYDISQPTLIAPKPKNTFSQDYTATGTPYFSFIDEDGFIKADGVPNPDWNSWKELVDYWDQ